MTMRYKLNIEDLYDDWKSHIVLDGVYAVRFPAESTVVKLARPELHEPGPSLRKVPLLIQVTAVDEINAYYKLCDYPDVHEQHFGLSSVMAGDLIEIF